MRLVLIFQCILRFQSQSIDFINEFAQADIPSGEPAFIELPRDFKNGGWKHDAVLILKKILYGQAGYACIWNKNLRNGLSDCEFVTSKVDPWLFMSKTVICVVYVDDFLFWKRSQSNIGNVMKSFKEDGSS